MVAIGSEWDTQITPDESVAARKKAYDKLANLQPALIKKQGVADTELMKQGMQGAYKGITQGGFMGRQAASGAADQLAMQMGKAQAQNQAEQDAYAMQTAKAKEDIIGAKQQVAITDFNRQTQEMQDQVDRVLTQRAFEMGMTAKELIFHVNSKIADIGLKNLQEEFDKGLVGKQELEKVKFNLTRDIEATKQKAEETLHLLRLEMQKNVNQLNRQKAEELQKKYIELKKDMMKKAAKSSWIGAMISGVTTLGGAAVGGYFGSAAGPGGTVAGATAGAGAGKAASNIITGAINL